MIVSKVSLEELSLEQHLTAAVTAVLGALVYYFLSFSDDLSVFKVIMSSFWALLAYYGYALASNVRVDGVPSVLVTLLGIGFAALTLTLTI